MRTNQAGIDLIKKFEGFSDVIYICPAGHQTIGYGHLVRKTEKFQEPMSTIHAEEILQADLIYAEFAVKKLIISALNENQFSALVSFVFNLGSGRLQSSTLRQKLNRGDYAGAGEEFMKWVYGGGKKLKGLQARRWVEKELFNTEWF